MSRLADWYKATESHSDYGRDEPFFVAHTGHVVEVMLSTQAVHPFTGYSKDMLRDWILSAKKMEARTRHKF